MEQTNQQETNWAKKSDVGKLPHFALKSFYDSLGEWELNFICRLQSPKGI